MAIFDPVMVSVQVSAAFFPSSESALPGLPSASASAFFFLASFSSSLASASFPFFSR